MVVFLFTGILPVYYSLFALSSSDLSFWYPPTHIFNQDKNILVHFRVRWVLYLEPNIYNIIKLHLHLTTKEKIIEQPKSDVLYFI